MDEQINLGELTDRELLLVIYTELRNHLCHHDQHTKVAWSVARIALAAALTGVATFGAGLLLILIQFGLVGGG